MTAPPPHEADGACATCGSRTTAAQPAAATAAPQSSSSTATTTTTVCISAPTPLPPPPPLDHHSHHHHVRLPPFSLRRLARFAGPGLLMSIAYVDPGNIESDLQAGVASGYGLLWVVAWATALGFLVQMQSAKLGVATGRDLAQHCRAAYPRAARVALWAAAQLAVVGADVQECVGSAVALRLLSGGRISLPAGVALGAGTSALLLAVERWGARPMEAALGSLVAVMVAAFGFMAARADVSASRVLRGFFIPRLDGGAQAVAQAVALLGSILMPHNTFLHSALVQSRRLEDRPEARRDALRYYRIESGLSLAVSVGINACVVSVFAAGFHDDGGGRGGGKQKGGGGGGGAETTTIGLENAGYYLQRAYGPGAAIVWALGLLAAGQSSTCTGTYTSQFLVAMLDAPRQLRPWARVALARAGALLPTLLVAALAGSRLDELSQWMNLLQALVLPCVLLPLLALNASPAVVGAAFANPPATTTALAVASAAVVAANLAGVAAFLGEALASLPGDTHGGRVLRAGLGVLGVAYAWLLVYLAALAPGVVRWGHGRGGTWFSSARRAGVLAAAGEGDLAAPLLPSEAAEARVVLVEEEEEEEEGVEGVGGVLGGRAQALALAREAAAADARDAES